MSSENYGALFVFANIKGFIVIDISSMCIEHKKSVTSSLTTKSLNFC
jgi:hypothetical protein